jgi:hypothetical protein
MNILRIPDAFKYKSDGCAELIAGRLLELIGLNRTRNLRDVDNLNDIMTTITSRCSSNDPIIE